jgi:6-hydroxynicotinate 3-monooxygenase
MAISRTSRIAVVGGGIGGCAVTAFLQRDGFEVAIYEQASRFARVGAGIHLSPNSMKVLRALDLDQFMLEYGDRPRALANRIWHSGELIFSLPLAGVAEATYGAPYVTIRRGDLHAGLISTLTEGSVHFGKRLLSLDQSGSAVNLAFDDGSSAQADIVIGADGLRSKTRELLHGAERPRFSAQVAFRASYPIGLLRDEVVEDLTKWWAPNRFVLSYFLDRDKRTFYFAAMTPQAQWPHETSSVEADPEEMLRSFVDFEPQVKKILQTAPKVTKWALFERSAQFVWGSGRIFLLGDACHAMRPFMAQGAAMALEDSAILSRCLARPDISTIDDVFATYSASRTPRLKKVHKISSENTWLRDVTEDPSWVFSHDALRFELSEAYV